MLFHGANQLGLQSFLSYLNVKLIRKCGSIPVKIFWKGCYEYGAEKSSLHSLSLSRKNFSRVPVPHAPTHCIHGSGRVARRFNLKSAHKQEGENKADEEKS